MESMELLLTSLQAHTLAAVYPIRVDDQPTGRVVHRPY